MYLKYLCIYIYISLCICLCLINVNMIKYVYYRFTCTQIFIYQTNDNILQIYTDILYIICVNIYLYIIDISADPVLRRRRPWRSTVAGRRGPKCRPRRGPRSSSAGGLTSSPRKTHGKSGVFIGKHWENHSKMMENDGTLRKTWENHRKTMGKWSFTLW